MAIKLIAFDLDGTLLNAKKEITEENRLALREAAARGIALVPATGRFYPGLPGELRAPACRYSILGNGTTVYDREEDRRLFEYEISLEDALAFFDYADSVGAYYDVYADDLAWISASFYERLSEVITDDSFRNMMKKLRHPVPDLREFLITRGRKVQKVLFYFAEPEKRREQLREMPKRFPGFNITSSIYCNIEINSRLADKGLALEALCRELGIDRKETMALGDGSNDLGMFRSAGRSVAMANAEEEVRAAADFVTASCEESGAGRAIWRYALGGQGEKA